MEVNYDQGRKLRPSRCPARKKPIFIYDTTHHPTDIARCECECVCVCGRGGVGRGEAKLPAPRTNQITKL